MGRSKTAIDQTTLSRFERELGGPAKLKGAYHYPPWSEDSKGTLSVGQKSLVFTNTLTHPKRATLNHIYI